MKTSMKKRIVSTLLALAMLASFLPADLFPRAEAVVGVKLEILELNPATGAFRVRATGPVGDSNLYAFALVPNVKVGATNMTPSQLMTEGNISAGTQTRPAMENALKYTGLPAGSMYVTGGENFIFDYDADLKTGFHEFTGTLPGGSFMDVKNLFTSGYYDDEGTLTTQNDITFIPYIAMLVTKGGTPYLATTNTTYATKLPAQLTADPSSLVLPEYNGTGLTATFDLKNAVGTATTRENAVVDNIKFVGNISEMGFDPERPTIGPDDDGDGPNGSTEITVTYDYPGYAITGDIVVTYHSAGAPNTKLTLTIPVTTQAFAGTPISVYVEQGRTGKGSTTLTNPETSTSSTIHAVDYDFYSAMAENAPPFAAEIVMDEDIPGLTVNVIDSIHSIYDEEAEYPWSGGISVAVGDVVSKEVITVKTASEDGNTVANPGTYTGSLYLCYANDEGSLGYTKIPITITVLEGIPIPRVTFDPNGGNWSGSTANIVKTVDETTHKLAAGDIPANPTKTGAKFLGWYDDPIDNTNKIDPATTKFDEFTTLYAQYEDKTYTITVNASPAGAASVSASPSTVKEGGSSTVSFTQPTQSGAYRFTGWTGSGITGTDTNNTHTANDIHDNLTFTANFTPIYNVSYSTSGSPVPSGETGILETDEFTLPSPGTKTGSTFQGWYTASTGGTKLGDAGDKITLAGKGITPSAAGGTATIYAQWTGNTYDVTANVASATPWGTVKAGSSAAGSTSTASVAHGGSVTLTATPSSTSDYSFDHWENAAGTSVSTSASYTVSNVTEAATYTAVFAKIAPTYTGDTVTFTYNSSGSQDVKATGPSGITYAIKTGSLPSGLTLNTSTGVISGTPTGTGAIPKNYTVTITATAGNGASKDAEWTIRVNKGTRPAPTVTNELPATTKNGHEGGFTIGNYATLNADPYNIGGLVFEFSTSRTGTYGLITTMDTYGDISGDTVTGLTEGSNKYIRVKENEYFNASDPTQITIEGPTTGFAEITVNIDDRGWGVGTAGATDGALPTITLQNATGATSSTAGNVVTFSKVQKGTYKVLANGVDTGKTVTVVVGETAEATVNYYTVTVRPGSGVKTSGVNTSGSDTGMKSAMSFLEGKIAYLRAAPNDGWGGGTWSFTITGEGKTEADKSGANTSITVQGTTTARIDFTQSDVTVTPAKADLVYGSVYGTSAGGSGSVTVATIKTTGDSGDTYTYGNVTGTLPVGMELYRNPNGTIQIWGRPQVVTTNKVTISFKATSTHNSKVVDVSFDVEVAKYNSTITVKANSGNHYAGDNTASSVTTTFTGPYWNGSKWVTVDQGQNSSIAYAPDPNLTGTGSCTVTATVTATGGGPALSGVWDDVTGSTNVTLAASHDVLVNVDLDYNSAQVAAYRTGDTVYLKETDSADGTTVANGSGALVAGTNVASVTLKNVPDRSTQYYVYIGSNKVGTVTVSGSNKTVTVHYYTLTLTAGTHGTITQTPNNDVYLSGQALTVSTNPATGYSFDKWTAGTTASGATASAPASTLTSRTVLYANFKANELNKPSTKALTYKYGDADSTKDVATITGTDVSFAATGAMTYTGTMPGGLSLNFNSTNGKITVTGRPHEVTSGPVTINYEVTATNGSSTTGTVTISVAQYSPEIHVNQKPGTFYAGDNTDDAATMTFSGPYYLGDGEGKGWTTVDQDTTGMAWTFAPPTLSAPSTTVTGTITDTAVSPGTAKLSKVWDHLDGTGAITATATVDFTVTVRLNGTANALRDGQILTVSKGTFSRTETISSTTHSATIKVPAGTGYTVTVGTDKKTSVTVSADPHYFDYYDVKYGACGTGGHYTTTPPTGTKVLVGAASDSVTKNSVTLPAITKDTNYSYKWRDGASPAAGDFGDGTPATTWTLTTAPASAPEGITLTPSFTPTGVNLKVKVHLDGQAYTSFPGTGKISLSTSNTSNDDTYSQTLSGGEVTFTNVTKQTYYIYVDGKATGVDLTTSETEETVNYYTVTTKHDSTAASLFVGTSANPTSGTSLVAMNGDTVHLAATPETGYSATAAKWSAVQPSSGNRAGSVTSPTTSGATGTMKVTGTTEVSVSFDANGLEVKPVDKMVAVYHMGTADWINVHNGEESITVTGPIDLAGKVENGSGSYEYTPGTDFPSYLEISGTTVQLTTTGRFTDNVGTISFNVDVKDTVTQKTAVIPMTLEIKKAQPKIESIKYRDGTNYYGEPVIQAGRLETPGTVVKDPYTDEDITQLAVANWTSNPTTFQKTDGSQASYTLTFKRTGADGGNYTTAAKDLQLNSTQRNPSPRAGTNTWDGDNPGGTTIKYGDTTAITVTVAIKNIGNSDIDTLTAKAQSGSTLAISDQSTTRNLGALAQNETTQFTFDVLDPGTYAANDTYTVTFDITASAGVDGSQKKETTTYAYTLTVEPAEIDHADIKLAPVPGGGQGSSTVKLTTEANPNYTASIVGWRGSDGSTGTTIAAFQPGVSYTAIVELVPKTNYIFVSENKNGGGHYEVNDAQKGGKGRDDGTLDTVTQTSNKVTMEYTFPAIKAGVPTIALSLDDTTPWNTARIDNIKVGAKVDMQLYYVITTSATKPSANAIYTAATGGATTGVDGFVKGGKPVASKTDDSFKVWDDGDTIGGNGGPTGGTPGTTYYVYAVARPSGDDTAALSDVGENHITLPKRLTVSVATNPGATDGGGTVSGTELTGDVTAAASQTVAMDGDGTYTITPKNTDGWGIKKVEVIDVDGTAATVTSTSGSVSYTYASAAARTEIKATFHRKIYGDPTITGTPNPGQTIAPHAGSTVTIGDTPVTDFATYGADLSYKWYASNSSGGWDEIPKEKGGENREWVVTSDYPGKSFKVVITYTGDPSTDNTTVLDRFSSVEAISGQSTITLETPAPVLEKVEVGTANGSAVAERPNGGLRVSFPKIEQDVDGGPDITYRIQLVDADGNNVGNQVTIDADRSANYEHYWHAELTNVVPGKQFNVKVWADTSTSGYRPSGEGTATLTEAGYKELKLSDLSGTWDDEVFNGTARGDTAGKVTTTLQGVGTIHVYYGASVADMNTASDTTETHVNLTNGGQYAVFVEVDKGTLYLGLTRQTYDPQSDWAVTQATATLNMSPSAGGKINNATELNVHTSGSGAATVTYNAGANTADAYNGSDVTNYYDITYTITAGPNTDASQLTGSSFTPTVEGTYTIIAHAAYKTNGTATDQFKADVGLPADVPITVTVADKVLTGLEVIGEDREATYGDTDATNFYDASSHTNAKRMGLDEVKVKLTWDNGDVETLTLAEFQAKGGSIASSLFGTSVDAANEKVTFSGAGETTVTMSYMGKNDTIKLKLNPRALNWHTTGDDKTYDGTTSVVNPGVALDENQIFATDTSLGADTVSLDGAGLTYTLSDSSVGTGRKVQISGTPALKGTHAGFYTLAGKTEGEVEILPAGFTVKVTTITPDVGSSIPKSISVTDVNSENRVTDANGNKLPDGTTATITWEWNDNGTWKEVTGDTRFQKGTEYRPVVIVTPPGNYQMETNQPNAGYTINGDKHGDHGAEITVTDNVGTFKGAPTKLSSSPILRFKDDSGDFKKDFTRSLPNIQEGGSLSVTNIPITFTNLNETIYDVELTATGDLAQYLTLTPAAFTEMTAGQEQVYTLNMAGLDTNNATTHTLTIEAKGAEAPGGTKNVTASYTISFTVRAKPSSGGGTTTITIEMPVVTYWVSDYGITNDLTAEKMSRKGAKPSFVPKITPIEGLKFLGWSETDPTKIKDGKLPTLVDPLTFTINEDKTFYAVYQREGYDHNHYVIGFPDGTFGPDLPITRAQVATIIARSCLGGFVEGYDYGNPGGYTDVPSKHWASSAIAYCTKSGAFNGYNDGTFQPDKNISRQELATVVARLAGVQTNQGLPFTDSADVSGWALGGVYTAYANGWITGYKDGSFLPKNDITRAETVKIFNAYLNRGVNAEGLSDLKEYVHSGVASNNTENGSTEYMTWSDVPVTHWAYYEVIEAANDHNFHWADQSAEVPPERWEEAFINEVWNYHDSTGTTVPTTPPVQEYTVTYVLGDHGTTWAATEEKVEAGKTPISVPHVSAKEGYVFLGWSETADGTYHIDPASFAVNGNKTYYAVYEETEPEYEIESHIAYASGVNRSEFHPDEAITRGDVAYMLANMMEYDSSVEYDTSSLSDVEGHWARNAIGYCVEEGLLSGYTDGTFLPDGTMTRQEFAVILSRLVGLETAEGDLPFTDAGEIKNWAKDAIYTAYASGLMSGYTDGSFQPTRTVTRAETVKVFNSYLGREVDKDSILAAPARWTDVSTKHWAYCDIMEATVDHDWYGLDGIEFWIVEE